MEKIGKSDSIEMNVQAGILTLKIDTTTDIGVKTNFSGFMVA